ncbi:MAG: exported protein of unknown function, putative Peptidase [Nitrospira sp.]|nr:exported protein of unknown function, putative Peptidase [Nitrospira sp.]
MHASSVRSITGTSLRILFLGILVLFVDSRPAAAESVVEIPILAAIQSNDRGVFEILLLRWDRLPSPCPMMLQWQGGNIQPGQSNLSAMARAFQYAVDHTPHIDHAGTVSAIGIAYASSGRWEAFPTRFARPSAKDIAPFSSPKVSVTIRDGISAGLPGTST